MKTEVVTWAGEALQKKNHIMEYMKKSPELTRPHLIKPRAALGQSLHSCNEDRFGFQHLYWGKMQEVKKQRHRLPESWGIKWEVRDGSSHWLVLCICSHTSGKPLQDCKIPPPVQKLPKPTTSCGDPGCVWRASNWVITLYLSHVWHTECSMTLYCSFLADITYMYNTTLNAEKLIN